MQREMLKVLHVDNHVLVVYKEAGVPVVPDSSGDPSLLEEAKVWVKKGYQKPGEAFLGVVHRLDRPVSGLVVFGRTSKGAARLSKAWQDGQVTKRYQGMSLQAPLEPIGQMEQWLLKDGGKNKVQVVSPESPKSKRALTQWRAVGEINGQHFLWLEPTTGRPHQLRVACRSLNAPLAGDLKYGATSPLGDGRRIALHAARLEFPHPTREERICISSDADFWPTSLPD